MGWCLALVVSVGALVYFTHYMIGGRHGLQARARLVERSQTLRAEVAALERDRAVLKRDVESLAADLADPDLVDELARDILGFGRPDDIVIRRGRSPL